MQTGQHYLCQSYLVAKQSPQETGWAVFYTVIRSTVSDKVLVQPRRHRLSPEGKAGFREEVGKAPKREVSQAPASISFASGP